MVTTVDRARSDKERTATKYDAFLCTRMNGHTKFLTNSSTISVVHLQFK